MSQFTHEVRNGIAWVTFDSGALNTLSAATIRELKTLVAGFALKGSPSPPDIDIESTGTPV